MTLVFYRSPLNIRSMLETLFQYSLLNVLEFQQEKGLLRQSTFLW